MNYRYKARDASGKAREGAVEAPDRATALAILQQNGLIVSQIGESRRLKVDLNAEVDLGSALGGGRVKVGELAAFCDQFGSLIGAGIPLLQALSVLKNQFKGKRLAKILDGVIRSVEEGSSLSQALRLHKEKLPPSMIYITSVAEVSGQLDEAMMQLARQYEQQDALQRKMKSAMTYPGVVMGITLMVLIFMITFVLPTYANMFKQMNAKMPASTLHMLALGEFIKHYYYLLPFGPLLIWFGIKRIMQVDKARKAWQVFSLRIPVWGQLVYKRELATLCRTLGTMARSGVPLIAGLSSVREAMNFVPLSQALDRAEGRVTAGESFGDALREEPIFDRISVEMIALGEVAGNLDVMLFRVSTLCEKDVDGLLVRLTSLLEPAMTVAIGGAVVSIIIPMILPMFDLLGQVK